MDLGWEGVGSVGLPFWMYVECALTTRQHATLVFHWFYAQLLQIADIGCYCRRVRVVIQQRNRAENINVNILGRAQAAPPTRKPYKHRFPSMA